MSTTDQPQHDHQWVDVTELQHGTRAFLCTDCDTTTRGCSECDEPLTTALTICDPCLKRARKIITDTVDAIATVPFHHAEIMGLQAVRYDRVHVTTSDDDARLPFGLDRVIEDPEDTRIAAAKTPATATDVLLGWARAWADARGDQLQPHAWATYLVDHTLWAAQNPQVSGWDTYLDEARQVRATVRRLLGLQPERQPAPCVHCGGTVVQEWTTHGLNDALRCTGCGLTWRDRTWLTFANLHTIHELPQTHPDTLVTIADAKAIYRGRIRPNLLDLWAHRGALTPASNHDGAPLRDVRGAALYRLGDIDARASRVGASAS